MVLTNEEIDQFCAANGVTTDAQRSAVHDAVRALEKAEGRQALIRMRESGEEELKRFLATLPEETATSVGLEPNRVHADYLAAAQKTYEKAVANSTLHSVIEAMRTLGYTDRECSGIAQAARVRMRLTP